MVESVKIAKMSQPSSDSELKRDVDCDKDKSIKSKQCNKFSIENILGLSDEPKVDRLELMNLCQKGEKATEV